MILIGKEQVEEVEKVVPVKTTSTFKFKQVDLKCKSRK